MANKAEVILRGTVVGEPKTGTNQNGTPWMRFNLSVQTNKKKEGAENSRYPYVSDFYNVFVSGREYLKDVVKPQTRLFVMGELYMGQCWQSKNGDWNAAPTVNADIVESMSGYHGGNSNNNNQPAQQVEQAVNEVNENEMPF